MKINTAKFMSHLERETHIQSPERRIIIRTLSYAEEKGLSLDETKALCHKLFNGISGIDAKDIDLLEAKE